MRIKVNTTSLLITIRLPLLIIIPGSARMIPNAFLYTTMVAYGQANQMNSNLTNLITPENIPPKMVGDIDIAYKIFGKGEPLLLIPGFSQANLLIRFGSHSSISQSLGYAIH